MIVSVELVAIVEIIFLANSESTGLRTVIVCS